MALKFKLVMRKNLGEDHESIPEKVYAQMVYECGVGPSFTAWQACQCR